MLARTKLPLLATTFAIAAGLLWWFVSPGGDARGVSGQPAEVPAGSGPGSGIPGSLAGAAPPDAGGAGRADAAGPTGEDELAHRDPTWLLTGSVAVPPGAPADPDLEVIALGIPAEYVALARALDAPGPDPNEGPDGRELSGRLARSVLARGAVAADGTFELDLGARRRAHLALRGRFLYLAATRPVERSSPAPVLHPRLGGWVVASVETASIEMAAASPDATAPEGATARLVAASAAGPAGFGGRPGAFAGRVRFEGASAQFRAVPPGEPMTLSVLVPGAAAGRTEITALVAGEERRVQLELTAGTEARGLVVDAGGRPVGGATVSARLPGRFLGFDDILLQSVECDADGRFSHPHLPFGEVRFQADHPAHLESPRRTVTLSTAPVQDGIDLVLGVGKTIRGRVIHAGPGQPAPGMRVEAWLDLAHAAAPAMLGGLRGDRSRTTSGADGRFELRGLGVGPYVVAARSEGVAARLEGIAGGREDVVLALRPPLVLIGRVVDERGEPVPRFALDARRGTTGEFLSVVHAHERQEVDDPEGRFLVQGLEPGTWRVTVSGDGIVSPAPLDVALPESDGRPLDLTVVRSATVRGRVVDARDDAVEGARVGVDPGRVGLALSVDPFPAGPRATTDATGAFELAGIVPGGVGLVADHPAFAPGLPLTLQVEPGEVREDVLVRLTAGGAILGHAYDAEGDPASGWSVIATSTADFTQEAGAADAAGEFRFENLRPGPWMVMTLDPGMRLEPSDEGLDLGGLMSAFRMAQANVREGEVTEVTIGAPPLDPVRVRGRVTIGDEPYAGVALSFLADGESLYGDIAVASADAEGRYSLELGGPGRYVVTLQKIGSSVGQQSSLEQMVVIPFTDEHRLDFELPLGRLSGRVLGPDGAAAAGARVTVSPAGSARSDGVFGGHYTEEATDGEGRFDVRALRPGRYRLAVGGASPWSGGLGDAFGRTALEVTIGEDEWKRDIALRLESPGSLNISVVDATDQPVAGAAIFVRDASGAPLEPFSALVTDSSGTCDYPGLAPGEFTAAARKANLASGESEPVEVRANGSAALVLRLEEATLLIVDLRDGANQPCTGSVSVTDEDGREHAGVFSMLEFQSLFVEGGFSPTQQRVGPLPRGRYEVVAVDGAGRREEKRVLIHGGDEKKVRIRFR